MPAARVREEVAKGSVLQKLSITHLNKDEARRRDAALAVCGCELVKPPPPRPVVPALLMLLILLTLLVLSLSLAALTGRGLLPLKLAPALTSLPHLPSVLTAPEPSALARRRMEARRRAARTAELLASGDEAEFDFADTTDFTEGEFEGEGRGEPGAVRARTARPLSSFRIEAATGIGVAIALSVAVAMSPKSIEVVFVRISVNSESMMKNGRIYTSFAVIWCVKGEHEREGKSWLEKGLSYATCLPDKVPVPRVPESQWLSIDRSL